MPYLDMNHNLLVTYGYLETLVLDFGLAVTSSSGWLITGGSALIPTQMEDYDTIFQGNPIAWASDSSYSL
jgi:hypothetical protein